MLSRTLLVIVVIVSSCAPNSQPERLRRFADAQQELERKSLEQRATPSPEEVDDDDDDDTHDTSNIALSNLANGTNATMRNAPASTDRDSVSRNATAQYSKIPRKAPYTNDSLPVVTHHAIIRTSLGAFSLMLFGKDAPRTVENFVRLAERKFYRGILVHRVAKDFVIQMGDPKTKDKRKRDEWGTGGESAFGEPFETEFYPNAPSLRHGYKRGTVAMAHRGPETNTSQFFICLRDLPELPLQYTIFGAVEDGMEVIDTIAAQKIIPVLNKNDGRPVKAIVITNLSVQKVRRKR